MGKCYSKVNKGQRKESDFYETPYSITDQFLMSENFNLHLDVLEPACGKGAMVSVLQEYFKNVIYEPRT